jgi:hypothetical protein
MSRVGDALAEDVVSHQVDEGVDEEQPADSEENGLRHCTVNHSTPCLIAQAPLWTPSSMRPLTDKVHAVAVPTHVRTHNQRNKAGEEKHQTVDENERAVLGRDEAPGEDGKGQAELSMSVQCLLNLDIPLPVNCQYR